MLARFFGKSWLRRATSIGVVAGLVAFSFTPAFGQHGGGAHSGGGHSGGGHSGGGHSGGGHSMGHSGGAHMSGGSNHSGHSSHYGGYGGGFGGVGIGGYSGLGYSSFGGYGGYGYPYGYSNSRLGYSGMGYSNLGYSNLGYSGLGYSTYSSARPSVYYSPSNSQAFVSPQMTNQYYSASPTTVVVPSVQRNSNVYSGPVAADGSLSGELRPGMVLPDGAVVVSVGPTK